MGSEMCIRDSNYRNRPRRKEKRIRTTICFGIATCFQKTLGRCQGRLRSSKSNQTLRNIKPNFEMPPEPSSGTPTDPFGLLLGPCHSSGGRKRIGREAIFWARSLSRRRGPLQTLSASSWALATPRAGGNGLAGRLSFGPALYRGRRRSRPLFVIRNTLKFE